MKKQILHILLFLSLGFCQAQICPQLLGPFEGNENVSVTTDIEWENLNGQSIYLISLGTTPGGTDILDKKTSGTFANFTPPKGLPEKTRIYVSIRVIGTDLEGYDCQIGSFLTEDVLVPPSCTTLRDPLHNAIFVREEVNIVWNYSPYATGYRITIGTSPGGSDIIENFDAGNSLFYDPPSNLPLNAKIYVKVIPYNENGVAPDPCDQESFAVRTVNTNLNCTKLKYPLDGAEETPKSLALQWEAVEGAIGYEVMIGTSPFEIDTFYTSFTEQTRTEILELESTHKYYVTIIPYNDAGEATGCTYESFTTVIDCGPFTDETTGEIVILNPIATLPAEILVCNNQLPEILTAPDSADGYRWYKIDANGNTALISEDEEVSLTEPGLYLYEIYNKAVLFERTIECTTTSEFLVVLDEGPVIAQALAVKKSDFLEITVTMVDSGSFEYSLDAPEGPFQTSNIFENLPIKEYTVFVRHTNGCGVSKTLAEQNIEADNFPNFFTPNGDGINDFWQVKNNYGIKKMTIGTISIFNRHGIFLVQVKPDSEGWDGTLNGKPLPSSEYWFEVVVDGNKDFNGHFSLKR